MTFCPYASRAARASRVARLHSLVLGAGLLLLACGGGGGDGGSATPVPSATPTVTPSPSPSPSPSPTPKPSASPTPTPPPPPASGFVNPFNADSPLGTNLTAVVDFAASFPFANLFKQARPWISGNRVTGAFDDGRPVAVDAQGHVSALATDQVARTVLFTGLPADPTLTDRRVVLRYDGDGDWEVGLRGERLSQAPGREVIRLLGGDAETEAILLLNLVRSNPADPIRNIRLTFEGGICRSNPLQEVATASACPTGDFLRFEDAATAGDIVFLPNFLNTVKAYGSVRFMDWLETNDSPLTDTASRPQPADAFWSTEAGVPWEACIALANLMGFDPWMTVPHRATDGYVRDFATLLRDTVDPARTIYVEYSNETWNGIFEQARFVVEEGRRLGLDELEDGSRNDFIGGLRFYSRRARQVFEIVDEVFGASRAARVERVMATQAVNPFLTETILGFENAAAHTDAFAIAPYFADTFTEPEQRTELLRLGIDGIFDWLLTDNNALLRFGSLASLDRAVADQKATTEDFGVGALITYEGGQHFLAAGALFRDAELDALFDAVNRDPRMATVYRQYLDNWRARTDERFWHFVTVDRWSEFGRWGAREFETQPLADSPKTRALEIYIAERPLP
jgi:hypothetical protein